MFILKMIIILTFIRLNRYDPPTDARLHRIDQNGSGSQEF